MWVILKTDLVYEVNIKILLSVEGFENAYITLLLFKNSCEHMSISSTF